VNIELYNTNTGTAGNDFAIDDIELYQVKPLSFTYSITQTNCAEDNSGLIVLYPNGGIAPYTFRAIDSQSLPITNTTGVFELLNPGIYAIGLMDATGAIDSVTNIAINPQSPIIISPADTSVCPNTSIIYTAAGGESSYAWTSSPNDLELTVLNQPNITVSPNITTTYSATSSVNNINLVYNGDFELGNTGFISTYQFQNSNTSGFDRTYGIVTNSSSWNNAFGNCVDHTFGNSSGKMMAISGSTYNLGNDVVWSQKIAIQPNKTYQFSYWVQTLELANPAQLDVLINGVSISTYTAVNQNCVWDQVFLTWNSTNNQIAEIQIVNKEYNSNGNSFSLDDLVFKTQNDCSANVTVTMKTEVPNYGIEYPLNVCLNENTIIPILGTGFISGGIFNVVEPGLNIDNLTGTISPATTTAPGTYHITYTAQVCGQYIPDTFIVNVRPLPGLLELTGGDYYCDNQTFNPLSLSVVGSPNWTIYYNLDGQPQVLANATSSPILIGNTYGIYDLDSISDAYCSNIMTGSQTISVTDAPQIPEVSGPVEYCKNAFAVALSVTNPNGVINWYLDSSLTNFVGSNFELLPSTQQTQTYYVAQTVNNCQGAAASITVTINNCDLIIPSAFTPNSDGDNDFWNITQLDEQFPENVVKVFNRWGEPIYESLPGKYSDNPWDGKFKGALMSVGTYYYVIQRSKDNTSEPLSGTITLILKK
jgi:gliding motility-associated-like protein